MGCRVCSTTIAIVTALLIAGCGGESGRSDEQQIRSVVNQFTVEVGGHNPAACSLMTPRLRRAIGQDVADLLNSYGAKPSCKRVIRSGPQQFAVPAPVGSVYASFTISKIVIIGKTATVAFNGRNNVVRLVKTGGTWLVNSA
jgi:hypothetical protein